MKKSELKTIGISSGLVLLNMALMAGLALTPASKFMDIAFKIPVIGVIVFGALISGGVFIAKRGIRRGSDSMALGGTALVQFVYAVFGAGIIGFLPPRLYTVAIGFTALISTFIAVLAGVLVYGTGHNFSNWRKYSSYMFLGVLAFAFIGSLSPAVIIVAFALALLGFITYLVYEIWEMSQRPQNTYMNAIGIYVAFMGVFVHILQIVVEMLLGE